MSRKKLAFAIVVPVLVLGAALAYWSSGETEPGEVASAPGPARPTAALSQPGPSEARERTAARRLPLPSKTPVSDGLTQALLAARGAPTAGANPSAAEAAIAAVQPLARQCFDDVSARYPPPQEVKLAFTVRATGTAGALTDGELVSTTIQDPMAEACFLDSLADARFAAPPGAGPERVVHTFSFGAILR